MSVLLPLGGQSSPDSPVGSLGRPAIRTANFLEKSFQANNLRDLTTPRTCGSLAAPTTLVSRDHRPSGGARRSGGRGIPQAAGHKGTEGFMGRMGSDTIELGSSATGQENRLGAVDEQRAASILGLSVATLRAWRQATTGPLFMKFGRAVRYRLRDLETFMRASEVHTTSGGRE